MLTICYDRSACDEKDAFIQFAGEILGPAPTSQEIAIWIRERIRRGQFVPDQRLVEVDLIRGTGGSRVRVREALQRLEAEGLVTIEPFRGASVKSTSIVELRHIYRARSAIEGVAAADFATFASDAQRSRLEEIQVELEACMSDHSLERFGRLNTEFHDLLVEGSGSSTISAILQRLTVPIHRLLFEGFYDMARLAPAVEDHRRILNAVLAGDGAAAEAHMRAHVDAGFEMLCTIEREYRV